MTLGKRIGTLRKDRKLSQEYVAETLGVSRQAVSKWENDLSAPDTENLIALAKLLGTDVEFLASGALSEDMISEPLPEPEPMPPSPKKRGRTKLTAVLLAVFVTASAVFGWLWQQERRDHAEVERLCAASANYSFESFRDYRDRGGEGNYWSAVADFRAFQQSLKVLIDAKAAPSHISSAEYTVCNQIYGFLLLEPARAELHIGELVELMAALSRDIYNVQAYQHLYELRSLLEHGG